MKQTSTGDSSKAQQPPVVSSDKLLGSVSQIIIEHNGEHYTLRITANNKLILTK
ncbi:MAG: hemin uptake protein HemP [Proteobacteria bacterium]|nr:hemin uptake protein HemP [Pseudomonadota bacterium]MDA0929138.1 hemin uptake protein HemP [Pseudomonadota bacterium]